MLSNLHVYDGTSGFTSISVRSDILLNGTMSTVLASYNLERNIKYSNFSAAHQIFVFLYQPKVLSKESFELFNYGFFLLSLATTK